MTLDEIINMGREELGVVPTPPEIPSGPPAYLAAAIVRLGWAGVNGG